MVKCLAQYLEIQRLYDKLEGLLLRDSLGSADGNVLVYSEGIKLENSYGKLFETILGNVNKITLGLDVWTDLGSLYGSLHGSNDGNLEGLFLVDSLVSSDGKVLGFD